MPFTSAWQSSKVPSTATAWMLESSAVVIIRRCTSETRPSGNRTTKIDAIAPSECLDRRTSGIARGRDHDGDALAALFQRMIHQPRQELHGEILEGERGPVEQFEQERIDVELRDRRHRRMAEGAVSLASDAGEVGNRDLVAGERLDHFDRHLGIGPAGKSGDGFGRKSRPGLRQIQSTVAGKACQRHIDEAESRGFAAGRHVLQRRSLNPSLVAQNHPRGKT